LYNLYVLIKIIRIHTLLSVFLQIESFIMYKTAANEANKTKPQNTIHPYANPSDTLELLESILNLE